MYYTQSAFLRLDCQIQLTKPLAVCKTVLRASFRNLAIVDAQLADNRFENITVISGSVSVFAFYKV